MVMLFRDLARHGEALSALLPVRPRGPLRRFPWLPRLLKAMPAPGRAVAALLFPRLGRWQFASQGIDENGFAWDKHSGAGLVADPL